MSFSLSLSGHIDQAIHDAEAIEAELVSDFKALVAKFESHITGASVTTQTQGSASLSDLKPSETPPEDAPVALAPVEQPVAETPPAAPADTAPPAEGTPTA